MKTFANIIFAISAFFLVACEDVVDVKLNEGTPALVVDGWITTEQRPFTITLSKTGAYFNSAQTPRVRGAQVMITDNEGNVDTLQESSPGEYVGKASRQGKVGNTYRLSLVAEGESYTASSEIRRVPVIDSIAFKYLDKTGTDNDGYYLFYYGPEPEGKGDNYRFKIIKNDTLLNKPEDLWRTSNDEWVDGNYISNFQVYDKPFMKGDRIKVEVMSITKDAYYFFTELATQVNNGSMFANPPANVRTNIINSNASSTKHAVGYFGASAVEFKERVVE